MIQTLLIVDEGPRWCRHATWLGPHRCESMILGSLTLGLGRLGLWPLPDAAGFTCSTLDLQAKLNSIVIHVIGRGKSDTLDHHGCDPKQHLSTSMENVMKDIPSRLASITFRTGQLDLEK